MTLNSTFIYSSFPFAQVLRNEFIYGTDTLTANVANTIESMCKDEVFQVFENDEVGLTQKQRDLGRRDFDVYLFLIWPFIEGYWLAACSLLLLVVPSKEEAIIGKSQSVQWFAAKEFEKRAQVRRRSSGYLELFVSGLFCC